MKADAKSFIKAWQTSERVEEVVRKLGISKWAAYTRSGNFRRKRIRLKSMKCAPNYDWKALAKYAESFNSGV